MPTPSHDATTPDVGSTHLGSRSTGSVSHTRGSSANYARALVEFKPVDSSTHVTGVSYGGQAMTPRDYAVDGTGVRVEDWYLASPPSGSQTVTFTLSASSQNVNFAVQTFNDVDTAAPHFLSGKANGTATAGGTVGVTITGATGKLVVDAVGQRQNSAAPNLTMVSATGRTQRLDLDTNSGTPSTSDQRLVVSDVAGSSSVPMLWTSEGAVQYAALAVALSGTSSDGGGGGGDPTPKPTNAVYYSTAGSDSTGTGSFESPWRTPAYALQAAASGSTVYGRGGTYTAPVISSAQAFSKASNVDFFPYPGETVIWSGTTTITNSQGVTINGTKFLGAVQWINLKRWAHDTCEINPSSTTATALFAFDGGEDLAVRNSVHHDCQNGMVFGQTGYVYKRIDIRGNTIYNQEQDGIQFSRTGNLATEHEDVVFEFNRIGPGGTAAHNDGIQIQGNSNRTKIRFNTFVEIRGPIIMPAQAAVTGSGGLINCGRHLNLELVGNVGYGDSDFSARLYQCPGAYIAHNSFYTNDPVSTTDGIDIRLRQTSNDADTSHWTTNVVLVNNIARRVSVEAGVTFATKASNLIEQYGGYTLGTGDVVGSPTYADLANGNLRLTSGSLGIGTANPTYATTFDLDGKLRGASPDRGAFQFTAGTPVAPQAVWGLLV